MDVNMGQTPNHGYNVPEEGAEDWHEPLNENFERHDTDIEIRGPEAALEDYEPKDGAKFLAIDTGRMYIGDGDLWEELTLDVDPEAVGPGRYIAANNQLDFVGPAEWENAGDTNTNTAIGTAATVTGGVGNTASGEHATVGGGRVNTASGEYATVGGGLSIDASGLRATVPGGWRNEASGSRSTVGGGDDNEASGAVATISGGLDNVASGSFATIGGGSSNEASGGQHATVGGGWNNVASGRATVGGGWNNVASGRYATVGGGEGNEASGERATIPGGRFNEATGDYAFAAGREAIATHDGSYVVGDSSLTEITSDAADTAYFQMAVHADDFVTSSSEVYKKDIRPADPASVLAGVVSLDISEWRFRNDDGRRHLGPTAEDFQTAFGLGDGETISSIDATGVTLAAIQGLIARLKKKDERSNELEDRLSALEASIEERDR